MEEFPLTSSRMSWNAEIAQDCDSEAAIVKNKYGRVRDLSKLESQAAEKLNLNSDHLLEIKKDETFH